ncbi:hypothetical protein ECANGB1_2055 [Enterospora canceri]|uniref:Uncharacterized protein n=1 Tax=Enterospora canceri TaxID=1081671 RepID=A0A1Y1S9H2_9MICR|nr:hypothetical protein ECANGB1_2055 [Enterospora canceri]
MDHVHSAFNKATVSVVNESSGLLRKKFKKFLVQLEQVKFKQSNSKIRLLLGIDLINMNAKKYNTILLENDILFGKECNNPTIGTEQAKISYKKRKNAIEAEFRETRRFHIDELKSKCLSAYIVINDLMITDNDIGNCVEIGKLYKKKCAELNIGMDDEIINMVNYIESINIDAYVFMAGELMGCLKICEILVVSEIGIC